MILLRTWDVYFDILLWLFQKGQRSSSHLLSLDLLKLLIRKSKVVNGRQTPIRIFKVRVSCHEIQSFHRRLLNRSKLNHRRRSLITSQKLCQLTHLRVFSLLLIRIYFWFSLNILKKLSEFLRMLVFNMRSKTWEIQEFLCTSLHTTILL